MLSWLSRQETLQFESYPLPQQGSPAAQHQVFHLATARGQGCTGRSINRSGVDGQTEDVVWSNNFFTLAA